MRRLALFGFGAVVLIGLLLVDRSASYVIFTRSNLRVRVELADTPEERQQGLSGRHSLPPGRGMLFAYQQPSINKFWMPNMRISLDIIWFDGAGKVVAIEESVMPRSFPQKVGPDSPTQYVLEVPAGFAAQHRLVVGDTAEFNL